MKVYELLYLFAKISDASIKNYPKNVLFIKNAYNKVIKTIKNKYIITKNISAIDIDDLEITDNMKNKLRKAITQKIPRCELMGLKREQLMHELVEIDGIGKSKAYSLIEAGLKKSIELYKPIFKKQLSTSTILLMKYKPVKNISYDDIKKIEKKITKFRITKIVGGYRRKKTCSKDIDVMLISDDNDAIEKYLNFLRELFKEVNVYMKGANKTSLIVLIKPKMYFKIDVFRTSVINQYAMLLYTTGSKYFNIMMRRSAARMGYLLNQTGLYKKGSKYPILVKSEKDIFDILKITYVDPVCR